MRAFILYFLILLPLACFSQDQLQGKSFAHKKGEFYVIWGWNRSAYTNSTIHFKGDDYNFKLYSVKAEDKQSKVSYHNYMQLDRITIPQTNFKIGYFIKDNLAINFGVDHMKYVMIQDQTVDFSGVIDHDGYFAFVAPDGSIKLVERFLTFEHTDGLNYINAEIEYYKKIYEKSFFKVNALVGGGAGFMLPKSNVELMNKERHDDFHLAGFGLDAKLGLEAVFADIAFIRFEGKEGYIDMPSIRTSYDSSDKASQHFFFAEFVYAIGVKWHF